MNKLFLNQTRSIITIMFLVILFMLNLIMSQAVMNLNVAIRELQEQLEFSQNQTRQLKVKAAKFTSNEYLLKRAKQLGFVETTEVVYLPSFEILAQND